MEALIDMFHISCHFTEMSVYNAVPGQSLGRTIDPFDDWENLTPEKLIELTQMTAEMSEAYEKMQNGIEDEITRKRMTHLRGKIRAIMNIAHSLHKDVDQEIKMVENVL